MDHLEPWNMFMFTNECMVPDTEVDASKDSQVKQEPEDLPQDDDSYITPETFSQPSAAAPAVAAGDGGGTGATGDEDDDTIFNFGLEPQVQLRESRRESRPTSTPAPAPTAHSTPTGASHASSDDQYVNFEAAVVYICPACGAEFSAQDAWKRHMNSLHNFNTRRGLNFVQVDKLYHVCLECHKRIAMHAMENLLKHKFTHLPYRCTKCKICLRQYKYRQDLMVHLRVTHRDDLLTMTRSGGAEDERRTNVSSSRSATPAVRLEIKDIKENAVDIFENTGEEVEVKNELLEPDETDAEADASNSGIMLPAFLEDALSRSSSHASDQRQSGNSSSNNNNGYKEELCEKYIQYICPQCGTEYATQAQWRVHIEGVHDFGTRKGLNFQEMHMNMHAQCLECKKVLNVNAIHALQLHKFMHLPHKSWLRCKLCFRSFVGHKEVVKHLLQQHRIAREYDADADADMDAEEDSQEDNSRPATQSFAAEGPDDDDESSRTDSLGPLSRSEERDVYEPQIDYLCPQCGKEFVDKKMWRKHIVKTHHLTDLKVLNFKIISESQVMCLECGKIITNAYGVQNAQQHRITHMPYKAFIRCRMCAKSYTDRKGLVKHLRSVHRVGQTSAFQKLPRDEHLLPRPVREYAPPPLQPKPRERAERSRPQKEIVQLADAIYEIQYLDDDGGDDEDTLDNTPVPELSFSGSLAPFAHHHRCADCGASFSTAHALQTHQQEEHEFLDFNNLQPLPESSGRRQRSGYAPTPATGTENEQSHDSDELLLVPTGDEELNYSGTNKINSNPGIERYFCYLCPSCGKEFKVQNDWRRHINQAHNFDKRHYLSFRQVDKYRFQCIECHDMVSGTKLKGLQDHKFRHLPYKLYIKCLLCSTCYNHKPNMISHLRMRHSIVDTRTPVPMEREYERSRSPPRGPAIIHAAVSTIVTKPPGLKTVEDCISFHNAVDHDTITYYCPQCNENFDTHVFWRKHIVDAHNLNSRSGLNFRQIDEHHYLCLQCYKRVTVTHTKGAIGQLQSHKFRHLPYKSFKCLACNSEFVRKQMFFKHLNRATNRCESAPVACGQYQGDEDELLPMTSVKLKATDNTGHEDDAPIKPKSSQQQQQPPQQQREKVADESLISQRNCFTLVCPQCGEQFDTWRPWREHINIKHLLGRRETLNFRQLSPILHQCRACHERVNGKKLRDLQIHKFKHLPFSAYMKCRFCAATYHHVRNMTQHLVQKHPDMLQKSDDEDDENDNNDGDDSSSRTLNDASRGGVADDADDADENENGATLGADADDNDDDDDDNEAAVPMEVEPEIEINSDSDDDSSQPNGGSKTQSNDDNEVGDEENENGADDDDDDDDEEGEVEEVEEVEEIEEPEEQFLLG